MSLAMLLTWTGSCEQTPEEAQAAEPVISCREVLQQEGTGPPSSLFAPARDVQVGECWVKLQRLPDASITAVRREFFRRNPDWTLLPMHIDPFTARVRQANVSIPKERGPMTLLAPRELARRRLAVLCRNADLIGMSQREVESLRWTSMHDAATPTLDPRFAALGELRGSWSVFMRFNDDATVSGFSVRHDGPVMPICAQPNISAEQARATRGITDASVRPETLGYFKGGPDVARTQVGAARLSIDMQLELGRTHLEQAPSCTWRLVWEVAVLDGAWGFQVDARDGQLVGLRKYFMQ